MFAVLGLDDDVDRSQRCAGSGDHFRFIDALSSRLCWKSAWLAGLVGDRDSDRQSLDELRSRSRRLDGNLPAHGLLDVGEGHGCRIERETWSGQKIRQRVHRDRHVQGSGPDRRHRHTDDLAGGIANRSARVAGVELVVELDLPKLALVPLQRRDAAAQNRDVGILRPADRRRAAKGISKSDDLCQLFQRGFTPQLK